MKPQGFIATKLCPEGLVSSPTSGTVSKTSKWRSRGGLPYALLSTRYLQAGLIPCARVNH